jgi:hypothetical protein
MCRSLFRVCVALWLSSFFVSAALAAEQLQPPSSQNNTISEKASPAHPADVAGDWQISWEVRLGTDSGTLHLQQDGSKLSGTFEDLQGRSTLSGTVDGNRVTFAVQFSGLHPFTTRFTGTIDAARIDGTSQAVDISGSGGAFLGHAGEVVHPEHPWNAKAAAQSPVHASEPSFAPKPIPRK